MGFTVAMAAASSLALAACSGSGRADAEGQGAKQPGPNPAEPDAAPAAESGPPPPPEQLVCEHIIALLALTSPSTESERAQTQAEEAKRIKEREEKFQLLADEAGQWQRSNLIRGYVTEVEHTRLVEFRVERPDLSWIRWQKK